MRGIMNPSKFDEIVKKRAHARVQYKIMEFKRKVVEAMREVTGHQFNNYGGTQVDSPSYHKPFRDLLQILASDDNTKGWPKYMWEAEEKQVTDDLLKIMDEMQKALLAPDIRDTDNTPAGEEGGA